jgi:L-ascorbate metabolism protein UlaG (beta-lactamase superfamily)
LIGQAGVRIESGSTIMYVDPYLSDSVEREFGASLRRMTVAPFAPGQVTDASIVLITHAHLDHCDPDTLIPLSSASPRARFIGSSEVRDHLLAFGITAERIEVATNEPVEVGDAIRVLPVPAAHPTVERDAAGNSRYLGYVIETLAGRLYHAGDTSITTEVLNSAVATRPLRVAMLPINERNYFRDRAGILGNMTVREAFQFASELGVETLLPIHWDMFEPNSVHRDEVLLLHRHLGCPFELRFNDLEL